MKGVINRAENNLTAKVLVTLFNSCGLSGEVLRVLGLENQKCHHTRFELFWKGFRDYAIGDKDCREKFLEEYKKIIPPVREAIQRTGLHMRDLFYGDSDRDKLFNELRNTEIDIALFSRQRIYLGEAKRKDKLGFNGRNILAHQFIRQRVMMEILKALTGDKRQVVSFIICDRSKVRSLSRMEQVKALTYFDGRRPPVLSWQEVLGQLRDIPGVSGIKKEVERILSSD